MRQTTSPRRTALSIAAAVVGTAAIITAAAWAGGVFETSPDERSPAASDTASPGPSDEATSAAALSPSPSPGRDGSRELTEEEQRLEVMTGRTQHVAVWRCMKDFTEKIGDRTPREAVGWIADDGTRIAPTDPVEVSTACGNGAHQVLVERMYQFPSPGATDRKQAVLNTHQERLRTMRDRLRSGDLRVLPADSGILDP